MAVQTMAHAKSVPFFATAEISAFFDNSGIGMTRRFFSFAMLSFLLPWFD
jgi:hypothetical protein